MPVTHAYAGDPPGLSGKHHWGHGAIGVPFGDVPSAGASGPALLANDTGLAADDEVRLENVIVPPLLTLFDLDELSRVIAAGPNGVHSGSADHVANGVVYGSAVPFTIVIGAGLDGDATMEGPAAGGGLGGGAPSALSGGATMDGPSAGGGMAGGSPSQLSGAATMGDVGAGGDLGGGVPSALSGDAGLDGPAAAGGLGAASSLAGDAVLAGMDAGGGGAGPSELGGAAALDGVAASGVLSEGAPSLFGGDAAIDGVGAAGGLASLLPSIRVYTLPSVSRVFLAPVSVRGVSTMDFYLQDGLVTIDHDPQAKHRYGVDLKRELLGDSLVSGTWALDGAAAQAAVVSGTKMYTSEQVAGGSVGQLRSITFHWVSGLGEEGDKTIYLNVVQQ